MIFYFIFLSILFWYQQNGSWNKRRKEGVGGPQTQDKDGNRHITHTQWKRESSEKFDWLHHQHNITGHSRWHVLHRHTSPVTSSSFCRLKMPHRSRILFPLNSLSPLRKTQHITNPEDFSFSLQHFPIILTYDLLLHHLPVFLVVSSNVTCLTVPHTHLSLRLQLLILLQHIFLTEKNPYQYGFWYNLLLCSFCFCPFSFRFTFTWVLNTYPSSYTHTHARFSLDLLPITTIVCTCLKCCFRICTYFIHFVFSLYVISFSISISFRTLSKNKLC